MLGYSFRDRLPEIEVQTLIVWGRNDILIPVADAYEFERLIGVERAGGGVRRHRAPRDARAAGALQRAPGRLHRGTGAAALPGCVIAPSDALETCAAYLASTPRVYSSAGSGRS